jgi:hypothetical protein
MNELELPLLRLYFNFQSPNQQVRFFKQEGLYGFQASFDVAVDESESDVLFSHQHGVGDRDNQTARGTGLPRVLSAG